jgi:hypothetical protein
MSDEKIKNKSQNQFGNKGADRNENGTDYLLSPTTAFVPF